MTDSKSFFGPAKRSFPFCFGGIWLFCEPFLIIGIYLGISALASGLALILVAIVAMSA
jgi:hypothetical protein